MVLDVGISAHIEKISSVSTLDCTDWDVVSDVEAALASLVSDFSLNSRQSVVLS